ncbi:LysR substrate-binding domain-containing protein [Undibacterium sp. TJN25]|uniref:LysR family transcriptional regulator n=1 Tax=Undibacterium sp. TJN25 TaxID=3413056 RepID=UPI003BF027E2
MMEQLAEMMVFAKVVEMKSFSAAANALNTSKSLISKQVSSLESTLGVRLLNRTTRSMSLTEIGSAYYQHCFRIAHEIEAARATASQLQTAPRGILKLSAPVVFAALHLAGAIDAFLKKFPDVEIELDTSDRIVDIVDEGYDLAIRITNNPGQTTVSRKILDLHWATCASPEYLKRYGIPESPHDLLQHNCLVNQNLPHGKGWSFTVDGKDIAMPVKGNCKVNSTEVMHQLALAGVGVGVFPTYIVGTNIQQGRLNRVLCDYTASPGFGLYATYMPNRYMQTKVRSFIDHLIAYFGIEPSWDHDVILPCTASVPAKKNRAAAVPA